MAKKILIAGASGFIGKAIIKDLIENSDYQLVGLSRYARKSDHPRLEWKQADLFSFKDISNSMEGCDEAIYLVHSMLPSASLSQGYFYDYDLILADNFQRAASKLKLKHILFLGGMVPENSDLSWHLRSRLEVENTLRSGTVPVTALRAGLIIGPRGSSFVILQRLIERLPILITPDWAQTKSAPVYLNDMIRVIGRVLNTDSLQGRIYDIAGNETVTYEELLKKTAAVMGLSRKFIHLNIIPLSLSKLWVKLFSGVHKDLVYPLVLSLKYPMMANTKFQWPYQEDIKSNLQESLSLSLKESPDSKSVVRSDFLGFSPEKKDVRSIQRIILPDGKNAEWISLEYFKWLPNFFSSVVKVEVNGDRCSFCLFHSALKILILERSKERSSSDRQLLYVIGGLLAGKQKRGRLEFREILEKRYILAALHEFRPALPWFIYKWSQAVVHLIVMNAFREHLNWIYLKDQK